MKEETINFGGYHASTKDLNSPEINRLAYSPQMDAHIASIKKQRKSQSDHGAQDIAGEVTDHIVSKAKGRVMFSSKKASIYKIKPKFCCVCAERVYTSYVINGEVYGDCCKSESTNVRASKKHSKKQRSS